MPDRTVYLLRQHLAAQQQRQRRMAFAAALAGASVWIAIGYAAMLVFF